MNKRQRKKQKSVKTRTLSAGPFGDGFTRTVLRERSRAYGTRVVFRLHKDIGDTRHVAEACISREALLSVPPSMRFAVWLMGELMARVQRSIDGGSHEGWVRPRPV